MLALIAMSCLTYRFNIYIISRVGVAGYLVNACINISVYTTICKLPLTVH